MMATKLVDLKPYKSLTLSILRDDEDTRSIVNAILADIKELFGLREDPNRIITEGKSRAIDVAVSGSDDSESVWVGFLHYLEHRTPPWYAGSGDYNDVSNELVVVFQRERHVAIYLSDTRRRSSIQRNISGGVGRGLGALELINRGLLNAAYVLGPTRTVWLSGIHAPVTVKPDTKVLSGLNLRDALDPLDDQTYHFTAARSSIPQLGLPVGVSPRGSRIWVGATSDWADYATTVSALLRRLAETTRPEARPLPVVAVEATAAPKLSEVFEFHFVAPELLSDSPDIEPEAKALMERWAYRSDFEITKVSTNVIAADVALEGNVLASIKLELDTSDPTHVRIVAVDIDPAEDARHEDISELRQVCQKVSWFKVWYESGHAIANGSVFEIRHRDEPFESFRWIDLSNYDPKQEKFWSGKLPEDAINLIGTEGSLFSWVRNNWTNPGDPLTAAGGWLACDDGAMEIADFIHLDDESDPPILSLIHVKGAKNDSPDRGISVSAYEVVVGQAVKNVRFLDRLNLEMGLRAGLDHRIGKLVWHERTPTTRLKMLDALGKIGASFRRLVVVLQPHVRRSRLEEVRADPGHKDTGRLRQLDTLLHAAQASCRDLGAQFVVLGDGT